MYFKINTKLRFLSINKKFYLIILTCILIYSCSSVRKVPKDSYLLKRNEIKINNNQIGKEPILGLIKQKPNKKFLGVKLKLTFYNIAKDYNQKGLSRFLYRIGEPPVILDTIQVNNTVKQISQFLDNHGYFYSDVNKKIKFKTNRKAIVKYIINTQKPYLINDIYYNIEDEEIKEIIYSKINSSFIKKNDIYNLDNFNNERERITTTLKNLGYFAFNKDYISFLVDSSYNNHKMNVYVYIKNPIMKIDRSDSVIRLTHRKFKIKNIFIYPDYNPLLTNNVQYEDSLIFNYNNSKKNKKENNYYFIYNDLNIRPKTYIQSIFLNQDEYFNLKDVEQTYNRLSELKNFRFININFNELYEDSTRKDLKERLLDCEIEISKNKVNSLSTEIEGSNSSGYFGIAGNLIFQNRNLFKGAEILNLKLRGVLENQKIINTSVLSDLQLFNTFETGLEASLEIPKFLIPVKQEYFPKYFKPKTYINGGYYYQNRPDFKRTISNISFGYDWRQSKFIQHIFNPIGINAVKIKPDSVFKASIEALSDKRLKYQYTDHFILNLKYSLIFSNQEVNKRKNFNFFRINFESAGNALSLYKKLFDDNKNNDGDYEVFKLIYSQYFRIDFDFRRYIYLRSQNTLVFRAAAGWGLPYGNSKQLPYEKSFIAGGANDIRAWRLRSLGPGSYTDSKLDNFDRIGDISLELNVENRFPIYKIVNGAIFVDAGNIWLNKANENFPNGEFKLNNFIDQIAIGTGFGLRLDLRFFIIRVDAAIPVKDPSKSKEREWVIINSGLRDFVVNFGVGYSF